MSEQARISRKKTHRLRPTTGHDKPQGPADMLFERRARACYKSSSEKAPEIFANEWLSKDRGRGYLPGLLRVGILMDIPEASEIVLVAQSQALKKYSEIVVLMINSASDIRSKINSPRGRLTAADERRRMMHATKLAVMESYIPTYEVVARRFCYQLRMCYPMYVKNHLDYSLREEGDESFGKFHCPCGAGNHYWRHIGVGIEETPGPFQKDHMHLPDYCGAIDSFVDLPDLMEHLKEKKHGPMHQAAMTYLLGVYYEPEHAIGRSAPVVGVGVATAVKVEPSQSTEFGGVPAYASAAASVADDNFGYIHRREDSKPAARDNLEPEGERFGRVYSDDESDREMTAEDVDSSRSPIKRKCDGELARGTSKTHHERREEREEFMTQGDVSNTGTETEENERHGTSQSAKQSSHVHIEDV